MFEGMKRSMIMIAATAALAATASPLVAQSDTGAKADPLPLSAAEVDIADFKWEKRPVVVFADTPADPRFVEQMRLLADRPNALVDRDVVVITDTDPDAQSALRTKLRPRGFMMVLIGKDGGVKLRKPSPWAVRELSRVIDKMPMRQQEINDARGGS